MVCSPSEVHLFLSFPSLFFLFFPLIFSKQVLTTFLDPWKVWLHVIELALVLLLLIVSQSVSTQLSLTISGSFTTGKENNNPTLPPLR